MNKNVIGAIVISTLLLLTAGIFVSYKISGSAQVEVSQNVKASLSETRHDWGNIGINDGKVEKSFFIKNEGTETLKLFNPKTSCMCTTAQIFINGEESPEFGMHDSSDYVGEVAPGESAELKAIFDPAFHGPSGTGSITRQVIVETNDATKPQLTAVVTANVIN